MLVLPILGLFSRDVLLVRTVVIALDGELSLPFLGMSCWYLRWPLLKTRAVVLRLD